MSAPSSPTLGIDFGTSNSAVSYRQGDGLARLIAVEGQATGIPTAMFFPSEEPGVHYGRDAMAQYLVGEEGRLLRSLKSLLGSSLLQDKTAVQGQLVSYQDIIARFLKHLVQQARPQVPEWPRSVVMGRPVHFVDAHPERDQQAQDALEQAARDAGFEEVRFQLEPIAAALDYERQLDHEALVLVVDIGGGTSDFTVVRLGPERLQTTDRRADILATTGVHIGGTDFDRRLSLGRLMPLLGLGHIGPHGREVPSPLFHDLATWHLIPWLYTPKALREAQGLRTDFRDAALHRRLMNVLESHGGHRLADAVEKTKIEVSQTHALSEMNLDWIEKGLRCTLGPEDLSEQLQTLLDQVVQCAMECVQRAGVAPQQLDALYLTGGSSALRTLQEALQKAFPGIALRSGDQFGGVALGLAYSR